MKDKLYGLKNAFHGRWIKNLKSEKLKLIVGAIKTVIKLLIAKIKIYVCRNLILHD